MPNLKAARKAVERLMLARTDEQRADLGAERLQCPCQTTSRHGH